MAGRIIIPGISPAFTANGRIDPTASFQFNLNRTDTPQDIFSTPDLDAALDNPLTPDSAGRLPPTIWGPDGAVYTVEWTPTGESPITFNDIALTNDGYDLPVYIQGKPSNGETYPVYLPPRNLRLPPNLLQSRFEIKGDAPTGTSVWTLLKNGSSIGTISFSTASVPTVAFSDAVDFSSVDDFRLDAPDTADATMADIAFTFVFQVV